MPRMYDRILARDFSVPMKKEDPEWVDKIINTLMKSPAVVADNVCEFCFAGSEKEEWHLGEDFPNLAPPFDAFWVETRRPSTVVSEVFGEVGADHMPRAWGALFVSDRNPDREADPRWEWRVNAYVFVSFSRAGGIVGPVGAEAYLVRRDGSVVNPEAWHWAIHFEDLCLGGSPDAHASALNVYMLPLRLAVSFMHCRNVASVAVEQSTKLSRKWQKNTGRPLVRYWVLDIDPMRSTLRSEGGLEQNGVRKALHICRGHFATYTEDRPLFGRHVGTFWKPQHVRGSAKSGVVVKDYSVQAVRT